ncbi:MAG TPA: acyl-CoA dehydrogenase, partial [Caulobacterales bacterium]|nr:acyl-CoA dehydrogenase [Caulobacterales bacterium]
MDFRLSDEQAMLKESVERFVSGEAGFDHARRGFAPAQWRTMAELGWLMLLIPEEHGGLGGSAIDAALIAEGLGRGPVISPYISTAVIAARLLAQADAPRADLLAAIGAGEAIVALASEENASHYDLAAVTAKAKPAGDGFALRGEKIAVQDGAIASHFLVTALLNGKVALFLVEADAPQVGIRRYRMIDHSPACDLALNDSPAALVIADAEAALQRAVDEARVLLAAETLGGMETAVSITADYLKTRKQFGRTLSSFQTLTHRIADMYVRCEQLRSVLLRALSLLDAEPAARAAAASAAMITAIDAGEFVCGQAIQLHGGIGMTEEYIVGHFYKRVRAIGRLY